MSSKRQKSAIALAVCALSISATTLTINRYRVAPVENFPIPVKTDSTAVNQFSNEKLLNAVRSFENNEMQNWTTVSTDSTGRVSLLKSEKGATIHTYSTNLRAQRFTKGKLALHTPAMAEVFINGVSKIKKTQTDTTDVSKDVAVTLNPEVNYIVEVHILSTPEDKGDNASFSLEFIADKEYSDIEVNSSADNSRRFEVEDINLGKRVASTSLSPNGKYLIVRYSEMLAKDKYVTSSAIYETASGKILSNGLSSSLRWMPSSNKLYECRKDLNDYSIVTYEFPSMKSDILARHIPVNDFYIAPTEDYIVYYDKVEGKAETGTMRRYKTPDDRIPGNRDRRYLVALQLKSGLRTPLTYGGAATNLTDFSADGKKLLYISMTETPDKFPFYSTSLISLDVETLATDTLCDGGAYMTNAVFSPDSRQVFITGGPSLFDGIGLNNGDSEIPNDFDEQGYLLDVASKKITPMTRDFDPSISGTPQWNRKNDKIYFRAAEGFDTPIFALDPHSGKIEKLSVDMPTVMNMSVPLGEDAWLSYVGQSFNNIGAAWLINLKNGKTRLIDDPMKSRLSEVKTGKIEPWVYTHDDGTQVDGVICYPPDFDASKKYPLIVYYYAGTTPTTNTMHNPYTPHLFASRDYVVYILNPSGTYGYGQEYSSRHVNAWGKRTADEIIGGVKQFCKEHPFINKDKIGCIGASYGGFMTQYLQTKTDIFAAAVSHAGISNVTSYWGEGYWGYSYNAVAAAKSYPWSNPELFTQQGSLFNADKIHTPLLLLHGTRDTNVPIGESIQIFNALKILGRDVEFITVDDQDHIINDYEKRKLWQNTIMAWFAKWLQDDPKWWNSLYGD